MHHHHHHHHHHRQRQETSKTTHSVLSEDEEDTSSSPMDVQTNCSQVVYQSIQQTQCHAGSSKPPAPRPPRKLETTELWPKRDGSAPVSGTHFKTVLIKLCTSVYKKSVSKERFCNSVSPS